MRLVLAVILLAACGGKPATGPAWPKAAEREIDGGESLAPRTAASTVVEASKDDDDIAIAPLEKSESKAPAETKIDAPRPTTPGTPPAAPPDDIIITTEEIVIEIDD
jgi:hypothetical protein